MTDMFNLFNQLNESLHGRGSSLIVMCDSVDQLCRNTVKEGTHDNTLRSAGK